MWAIWDKRNRRIFECKASSKEEVWERVKFWVGLWLKSMKEFNNFAFSNLLRIWGLLD